MSWLLDKPVFVYFGAAALLSLGTTAFLGFNLSRFGFKKHRFFALLTLSLGLIHLLGAAFGWY